MLDNKSNIMEGTTGRSMVINGTLFLKGCDLNAGEKLVHMMC